MTMRALVEYSKDELSSVAALVRETLSSSGFDIELEAYPAVVRATQDLRVVVGYSAVVRALSGPVRGGLVAVLTDLPGTAGGLFPNVLARVEEILGSCLLVVVGDESERALLESVVPGAAGSVSHLGDPHLPARLASLAADLGEARDWASIPRRKQHVGVIGHDLRHVSSIVESVERVPGCEVRNGYWELERALPSEALRRTIEWADVLLAEWAGRQAVWLAQHKRADQRLVVRLHGFEAEASWFPEIDPEAVDTLVVVSPSYGRLIEERFPAYADRLRVVPNVVDVHDLHRSKMAEARFHIGMLGYAPLLKRPDRAVDLLEELLAHDDRFVLHFRGQAPWEIEWLWNRRLVERESYRELYERIGRSDMLRGRITFEQPGADVASWLQRIGWILSFSDRESFHIAPVEGMASGAVPLLLQRAGVEDIVDERWIHATLDGAVRTVLSSIDEKRWRDLSADAVAAASRHDVAAVRTLWREVLLS